MARHRDTVVRLFPRRGRRGRRPAGRWGLFRRTGGVRTLVLVALAAALIVGNEIAGPAFPTLADFAGGAPAAPAPARPAGPAAERLSGAARVIDGDTLDLGGVRVRLSGIDAPEKAQTCQRADGRAWACGAEATAALRRLAEGQPMTCEVEDRDRYGRAVSRCQVGGADVGRAMVRSGLALAYRRYSTRYVGDEADARRREAGLWAGAFESPSDWRGRKRG